MGSIICRRCAWQSASCCILFVCVFALSPGMDSQASDLDPATMSGQPSAIAGENLSTLLAEDGRYLFRAFYSDGVDILKLPRRIQEVRLTDVLIATVVLGTIPATIYGLDDPLRRHAKIFPIVLRVI